MIWENNSQEKTRENLNDLGFDGELLEKKKTLEALSVKVKLVSFSLPKYVLKSLLILLILFYSSTVWSILICLQLTYSFSIRPTELLISFSGVFFLVIVLFSFKIAIVFKDVILSLYW